MHRFQNYWNFDREWEHGEHKTDFRAQNVPGTFEKQAPGDGRFGSPTTPPWGLKCRHNNKRFSPFRILIYRTWAIKWKRHFDCLLTWLRGFLVILVWCSLCSNLFWELRDNWVEKKNCNFDPKASESCQNFNISKVGCGHTRSMCSTVFIARPPFPSLPLSYPTHFNEADEEKLSPWENSTVVVSTNYFKLPLPCFYF